ncbi:MAG: isocitrate lyase/PEP mutase family protein [Chloroflexi bacterium]|nr:isocitrate lyase/PEP mutase family protein [Chloroflexota bacterium]
MSVSDFKKLLDQPSILVVPGAADALTARLVEDAGFAAVYVSGAGIANTQFAIPDIGLLTMTEMTDAIRRIVAAVGIPLIADADTGYGAARNVVRTVQAYEAAGVAALQVEDQVTPKVSGHFNGKEVIPAEEMSRKIEAAARARDEMLIIARTDSLAMHGFQEATRRAKLFANAGADLILIEAPTAKDQIADLPKEICAPLVFNMTEGAQTPMMSHDELGQMGYKMVIHPSLMTRIAARAVQSALAVLQKTRSSELLLSAMLDWGERQRLTRFDEWEAIGS